MGEMSWGGVFDRQIEKEIELEKKLAEMTKHRDEWQKFGKGAAGLTEFTAGALQISRWRVVRRSCNRQ